MDDIFFGMRAQSGISQYVEQHLVATDTTHRFEWFTDWVPAIGVDSIRAVLKGTNTDSGLNYRVAYQMTPIRVDNPGSPSNVGATQTGSGGYCTATQGITTSGMRFIRFGVEFWSGSSTVTQGDISLWVSWNCVGSPVSTTTIQVDADNVVDRIAILTPWIPRIYAAKVQAAIVGTGVTGLGTIRYELVAQTAPSSFENPSAWDTSIHSPQTFSSNTEYNTGDLTLTSSNDMWVRFGLAYGLSTGTDQTTAIITATVAVRQ